MASSHSHLSALVQAHDGPHSTFLKHGHTPYYARRPMASSGAAPGAPTITWEEIKVVQNMIERCLQQYMTQAEIITALQSQAHIDPGFTCLVWAKLEEQNPDFFYAYGVNLRVKDQVTAFNYLTEQHVNLVEQTRAREQAKEQEQEPEQGAEGRVPTSQALEEGEERGSLPA